MGFERAGFGYTDTGKPEVRGYGRRWFAWGLPGSDRELRILAGVQIYISDVLMGSRFSGLRLRAIRLTRYAQSHELSLCGGEFVCQIHLP